jgi:effector-binding domain-containing protein
MRFSLLIIDMSKAYNCEILERQDTPTLSVRTRTSLGELPRAMQRAYASIFQYLMEMGEEVTGPPYTAYYNMDMEDLDVEMGFPVSRKLPNKKDIQASSVPGGRYATCLHRGAYSDLQRAYSALSRWIGEKEYEVTGIVYEFYLNDPSETPPDKLETRILFPLK